MDAHQHRLSGKDVYVFSCRSPRLSYAQTVEPHRGLVRLFPGEINRIGPHGLVALAVGSDGNG